MDQIAAMRAFVRVVEAGSFTRAADSLAMPRTTLTKLVQRLEAHLSARLLNRTTRKVTVTADGAAYYERAARLLNELQEMEAELTHARVNPRGRLRVDVSAGVGVHVLVPALPEFFARYPDIQIDLGVSDRPVDLVAENVDCVVRGGTVTDLSLTARRIGDISFIACASPQYVARHGMPAHPSELENDPHRMVSYFFALTGRKVLFDFSRGDQRIEVQGRYTLSVNDANAYVAAGIAGLGIIQVPTFMVERYLASGELMTILDDWTSEPLPIHVGYQPHRHLSTKLRAFVDWVAELFARCGLVQPPALPPPGESATLGSVRLEPPAAVRLLR